MKKIMSLCIGVGVLLFSLHAVEGAISPIIPTEPAKKATPATPATTRATPATPATTRATPATPATPPTAAIMSSKELRKAAKEAAKEVEEAEKRRGFSAFRPFLPNSTIVLANGRIRFILRVVIRVVTQVYWFDPVVATGYDYAVVGPKVTGLELPKGIGDNMYDLWLFNEQTNKFADSGVDIAGGELYQFANPVSQFSVRGIETSAGLDPKDEVAFPTGLRFEKTGRVQVSMTSMSAETK